MIDKVKSDDDKSDESQREVWCSIKCYKIQWKDY